MKALAGLMTLLLLIGCGAELPSARQGRDVTIGIHEGERFRFEASDGLLHVTKAEDRLLELRASAGEFRFQIDRKDPTLRLVTMRIANLIPGSTLETSIGRFAGTEFDLYFPTGVDRIEGWIPEREQKPFVFLAFGDIQNGISRFDDMVNAVNQESEAEFILMLGDLSQRSTPEQFERVEEKFRNIRIPVFATPGNHDIMRTDEYQRRFGRANYTFTHRGVRITSIDSSSGTLAPDTWTWLEGWLSAGQNQLHAIISHIPVIEDSGIRSGQWSSRREARKFVSTAAKHRVDLLLFGHIHSFDEYSLGGIPTYISGGCGAIEEQLDGIDRHYLRITADPVAQTISVKPVRIE